MKNCREMPNFAKTGGGGQIIYIKTLIHFTVTATLICHKSTEEV